MIKLNQVVKMSEEDTNEEQTEDNE